MLVNVKLSLGFHYEALSLFQAAFHRTKARLEQSPEERQFEFSEMYIFGKFDTFSKRLQKIMHMFELIESYSKLGESKIEGIERYSTR